MKAKDLKALQNLKENGYAVIKNAIDPKICELAIFQIERMKNVSGFNQRNIQEQKKGECSHFNSKYIVDGNIISYFFDNSNPENVQMNEKTLIKIGHTLHMNKIFVEITYSKVVKQVEEKLEYQSLVVQSMVLQKLPTNGGTLPLHQDSTYLLNEPDTVIAWWVPLQNVTKQNGCVWVLPKTHKGKLYQQYKIIDGKPTVAFNNPIEYNEQDCIAMQMQKGDLLLFYGKLLHKSNNNMTDKSRYAYTWHTMDKRSKWGQNNWRTFDDIKKDQKQML